MLLVLVPYLVSPIGLIIPLNSIFYDLKMFCSSNTFLLLLLLLTVVAVMTVASVWEFLAWEEVMRGCQWAVSCSF